MFDEGIGSLPSAGDPSDKFLCCDACMRKADKRELAQIYCIIGKKKFGTAHEKVGDSTTTTKSKAMSRSFLRVPYGLASALLCNPANQSQHIGYFKYMIIPICYLCLQM